MRIKNNGMLFGALLIVVGLYILIGSFNLALGFLPWLAIGATLLFLYYNKRNTWALACGIVLTELSMLSALNGFGVSAVRLPHVLFFFIPGTVFMALFVLKNKQGLLIPGAFLMWFGLGLVLKPFIPPHISIITICAGMAFITVYLLGNWGKERNYLYIGIIVLCCGAYSFIKPFTAISIGKLGWLVVVALCAIMIIKRKKSGD